MKKNSRNQVGRWARFRAHVAKSSKKRKTLYAILTLMILYVIGMVFFGGVYQLQHRKDKIIMGTSFTPDAAEDLGVDWKANYTALLDDLQIRHFRLMSYWE